MSTLPNIRPMANAAALPNNEAAGFSGAAANPGEAFDELMTRALAPADQSKNTSPKSAANHSKEAGGHGVAGSAPAAQNKNKITTSPLPFEIIAPQISAPVEVNPIVTAKAKTTGTTGSFGKNVGPTAGQISAQIGSAQKNINGSGATTTALPIVAAASNPANSHQVANEVESAGELLATSTLMTALSPAKSISDAPAKVSTPNASPTQSAGNSSTLAAAEITGEAAVSLSNSEVTAKVINLVSVASTVTETLPVAIAPANPAVANPASGKIIPKNKTDGAEKIATDNGGTAKEATSTDLKTALTAAAVSSAANEGGTGSPGGDDSKSSERAGKTAMEKTVDNSSAPTLFSGVTPAVAGAAIAAPPASVDDGTWVAKPDGLVSDGEKANKNEGFTGKILPGSGAPTLSGNDLPVRAEQLATAGVTITAMPDGPTAAAERVGNPAVDDLNLQTLERTHELVALHAMRLSEVGTGALQLVIKPAAGTQLSLELRQRENGIEAQAVLQQGDFKHLSQHWPELQQRLEQRGIRLADLTDAGIANHGNGGSGMFGQKQNQSVEAFAGYATGGSATGTFPPAKTRVSTHAGWETWA